MNKLYSLIFLAFFNMGFTQKAIDPVSNFYGIPEVLAFDKIDYKLAASYHPNDTYYKQEYIPAGEQADHFNKMVIVDFVITDVPAKEMAAAKENEIDGRKKTDGVARYEIYENKGEYMLDFTLSQAKGDKVEIVEHNTYRYKSYMDTAGHKGILLVGISTRGYGDGIVDFFKNLKKHRIDDINKLGAYDMPKIELK